MVKRQPMSAHRRCPEIDGWKVVDKRTGMPPFFPPVAPCMAVELALMCGAIALVVRRWPRAHPLAVLVPVLLAGREAYAAMIYGVSLVIELPGRFLAGVSLLSQG